MIILLLLLIITFVIVAFAGGAIVGAASGLLLIILSIPIFILFLFVAKEIVEIIFDAIVVVIKCTWLFLTWPIRAIWRDFM